MTVGGLFAVDVSSTIAVELIITRVVDSKTSVVRTTDVTVEVVEFSAAPWGDLRKQGQPYFRTALFQIARWGFSCFFPPPYH
jgi:hypothetical protein